MVFLLSSSAVYKHELRFKKEHETMKLNLVDEITKSQLRTDLPDFGAGCTVRVDVRIQEGDKTRIQTYEGVVIARSGSGISETFIVRKISNSIGVERTFPVHSPILEKITVLKRGKVRRSKLYYMRGRSGKASRLKEIR
jgi:large subunit ribosomal protein L19